MVGTAKWPWSWTGTGAAECVCESIQVHAEHGQLKFGVHWHVWCAVFILLCDAERDLYMPQVKARSNYMWQTSNKAKQGIPAYQRREQEEKAKKIRS